MFVSCRYAGLRQDDQVSARGVQAHVPTMTMGVGIARVPVRRLHQSAHGGNLAGFVIQHCCPSHARTLKRATGDVRAAQSSEALRGQKLEIGQAADTLQLDLACS